MILPVQSVDGGKRFVVVAHLDEAKSTTPAGLTIAQDLGGADCPKLFENLLKLRRRHSVLQVTDIKPLRHRSRPQKALPRYPLEDMNQ
jgi:hypothetical protein